MKIEDIRSVPWEVDPTPVRIVGTTFGNELQVKISNLLMLNNFFLFFLCTVTTLAHLGWFK